MKQNPGFIIVVVVLITSISNVFSQDKEYYGITEHGGDFLQGNIFKVDSTGANITNVYSLQQKKIGKNNNNIDLCISSQNIFYGMSRKGGDYNCGIIYKYNAITNHISEICSFDSIHGKWPTGGLIKSANGKYYGTTLYGGLYNQGVLFEFDDVNDSIIVKTNFSQSLGIIKPEGKLFQASNNKLFGTTATGSLYEYDITNDSCYLKTVIDTAMVYCRGLIEANGSLYGLTYKGGSNNKGLFFKYNIINDSLSILMNFIDSTGTHPSGALVKSSTGILYGTLSFGALHNNGCIFSLDPNTDVFTKEKDIFGLYGLFTPKGPLVFKDNNTLLGLGSGHLTVAYSNIFSYHIPTKNLSISLNLAHFSDINDTITSISLMSNSRVFGVSNNSGYSNNGYVFQFNPFTKSIVQTSEFMANRDGTEFLTNPVMATNGKLYGTAGGGLYNKGVLYEYDASIGIYTKMIDFDSIKGHMPYGDLIIASNGKLYGTTYRGGAYDEGTLYEYNFSNNSFVTIYDFNNLNGKSPYGGVIQASNGKLYGLTEIGGQYNHGILYEYNINTNAFMKKIDFSWHLNGRWPRSVMTEANNGKLYGTTMSGGSLQMHSAGSVFEYDYLTNILVTKANFTSSNGFYPKGSLCLMQGGNLYGTTYMGGLSYSGVIFQYNIYLDTLIVEHDSASMNTANLVPISNYQALMISPNGSVYEFNTVSRNIILKDTPNVMSYTAKGNKHLVPVNICYASFSNLNVSHCSSYTVPSGNATYTISGTYQDILTNVNGCDSIITIELSIIGPNLSVNRTGAIFTVVDSADSYQWLNCNNSFAAISGEVNQSFTATANGSYSVELVKNNCIDTTICYTISNVSNLINEFSSNIDAYPNPSSGIITIDLNQSYHYLTLSVKNIVGQEVLSQTVYGEKHINICIPGDKGVYFIEIVNDKKEIAIFKFIKI